MKHDLFNVQNHSAVRQTFRLLCSLPLVRVSLILLLGATGGCSVLEPKADLTQFYVLRPVAAERGAVPSDRGAGLSIQVGPGQVADYLQSTPLLVSDGVNRLKRLDQYHWAEPLAKGISRVLTADLAYALPAARLSVYPNPSLAPERYELRYTINRFEGALDGPVVLDVTWQVVKQPDGATVGGTRSVYEVKVSDKATADVTGYVERMGMAIGRWCQDVMKVWPTDQKMTELPAK